MRIPNWLHATVLPHASISSIIPLLCNQHACRKSCIIHISILQCTYTFWHTGVPELHAFTHPFICPQASLWWISFLCNVSLVYFLYCNCVQTSRCSSKVYWNNIRKTLPSYLLGWPFRWEKALARPKSASFRVPDLVMSTFAAFMSRCRIWN